MARILRCTGSLLNQRTIAVILNFEVLRSFIIYGEDNKWSQEPGINCIEIASLPATMANIKAVKNHCVQCDAGYSLSWNQRWVMLFLWINLFVKCIYYWSTQCMFRDSSKSLQNWRFKNTCQNCKLYLRSRDSNTLRYTSKGSIKWNSHDPWLTISYFPWHMIILI